MNRKKKVLNTTTVFVLFCGKFKLGMGDNWFRNIGHHYVNHSNDSKFYDALIFNRCMKKSWNNYLTPDGWCPMPDVWPQYAVQWTAAHSLYPFDIATWIGERYVLCFAIQNICQVNMHWHWTLNIEHIWVIRLLHFTEKCLKPPSNHQTVFPMAKAMATAFEWWQRENFEYINMLNAE